MQAFNRINSLVAPLDRANVDTDAIIPKQFMKSVLRTGYGENLFDEWRYRDLGTNGQDNSKRPVNHDFVLNQERYQGAQILLARENFGCGSSREHAVWALLEFGFRVIIAPSFADIFYINCCKNGLLPLCLSTEIVEALSCAINNAPGYRLDVDLEAQTVSAPEGAVYRFEIDPFRKHCFLDGVDEIGLTLRNVDKLRAYEARRYEEEPWLFPIKPLSP